MRVKRAIITCLLPGLMGCPGEAPEIERDIEVAKGDHRVTLVDASGDGTISGSDSALTDDGPVAQVDQSPGKDQQLVDVKPWPQPDSKPSAHDIGKTCTSNGDCMFKICATNTHTGTKFCTKTCNPCTPSPCPTGSGCQNAGIAYICAPGYPDAPCPP